MANELQNETDVDMENEMPSQSTVFTPPSVIHSTLFSGESYTHFSPVPPSLLPIAPSPSTPSPSSSLPKEPSAPAPSSSTPLPKPPAGPPCALGVDEAGRGPVLGPMVYGAFYLPIPLSTPLLSKTHHFDDSKVLTAGFRAQLMETLCTPTVPPAPATSPDPSSLYDNCGWAVSVLSARAISANMMQPATYNLNEQAMDATIHLIKTVYEMGVNVREIYIDTIGQPGPYQKKLERIFPTASITVAKKADSLYPCVSAASVCAKVTRDRALEVLYEAYGGSNEDAAEDVAMGDSEDATEGEAKAAPVVEADWGSGYPSDARCSTWLKRNIDPVFGWGPECRFSWSTTKDLLEDNKSMAVNVDWPVEEDEETHRVTDYFSADGEKEQKADDELGNWFGRKAGVEAF
ncbi:hypothetical protein ACLOAV_005672 [Pseudogymnoascus australis]